MASTTITAREALAAWDAGDLVWTVEMGGMGPGYEQAIQMMAFEFLRYMLDHPPVDGWESLKGDDDGKKWRAYRNAVEASAKAVVLRIGPSGAQFDAAMNIANVFAARGYSEGLAMAPDRHILCSRTFPADPA